VILRYSAYPDGKRAGLVKVFLNFFGQFIGEFIRFSPVPAAGRRNAFDGKGGQT